MATKEQVERWQKNWATVIDRSFGKKIDSVKFEDGPAGSGKERVTIILADGTRLGLEAPAPIYAWIRRCGHPNDGPCQ